MRTAEEILSEKTKGVFNGNGYTADYTEEIIQAMKTYAKEAIEECAKVHSLKWGDVRALAIKDDILKKVNELQ